MDHAVLILWVSLGAICTIVALAGCASDDEGIVFPYTVAIAEGNHLFVMGHHFTGVVAFTWEPGDSVRVVGMAVYPIPKAQPKQISEERLEKLYGNVPFLKALVEQGSTWKEAAHLYSVRQTSLELDAMRMYFRKLESTGSPEAATRIVLDSLDRSIFDPDFEIEWAPKPLWQSGTGFCIGTTSIFIRKQSSRWIRLEPDRRFHEMMLDHLSEPYPGDWRGITAAFGWRCFQPPIPHTAVGLFRKRCIRSNTRGQAT